jgi:hypothetical protein
VAEPDFPSAVLTEVEAHSCVLELLDGHVTAKNVYMLEGRGIRFLAGRVMWVHGSKAGLFFKNAIHQHSLDRLRRRMSADPALPNHSPMITLRCVADSTQQ